MLLRLHAVDSHLPTVLEYLYRLLDVESGRPVELRLADMVKQLLAAQVDTKMDLGSRHQESQ